MKNFKKIMMSAFTVMTFCFLFANVQIVNAETSPVDGNIYINLGYDVKGNVKQQKKIRVVTYSADSTVFDVRYGSGDKIMSAVWT